MITGASSSTPPTNGATLEDVLRRLGTIAGLLHQSDSENAAASAVRAFESGDLRVAVLGQFKRGKSTLLNALLGQDVLPTGVLPLTAVATEVRDGPGEVRVEERDGPAKTVPLAELAGYVTEAENPENAKGVRRVEVRIPLPAWARQSRFFDSPGIGSVHDATSLAARRMLSEIDAAIFVLSPDPPLSGAELEFLREVTEYAAKFFFVLNKADLVPASALGPLTEYTQQILRTRAGFPQPRLFVLSARADRAGPGPAADGADLGLPALRTALAVYLGRDRDRSVQEAGVRRALRLAQRLRGIAELARRGAELSRVAWEESARTLESAIEGLDDERRAADALLTDAIARATARIDGELVRFQERGRGALVAELDAFLAQPRRTGSPRSVRAFNDRLRTAVLPRVAELRQRLDAELARETGAAFRRYERRIQELLDRVDRVAGERFRVQLPSLGADVPLAERSRYYPRVSGVLEDTFAGQTLKVLPAAILLGRLRRQLPRIVAEELDGQSGRLKDDLVERSAATVATFRSEIAGQVDRSIASIRAALAFGRGGTGAPDADGATAGITLGRWIDELDGTVARLRGSLGAPTSEPAG